MQTDSKPDKRGIKKSQLYLFHPSVTQQSFGKSTLGDEPAMEGAVSSGLGLWSLLVPGHYVSLTICAAWGRNRFKSLKYYGSSCFRGFPLASPSPLGHHLLFMFHSPDSFFCFKTPLCQRFHQERFILTSSTLPSPLSKEVSLYTMSVSSWIHFFQLWNVTNQVIHCLMSIFSARL